MRTEQPVVNGQITHTTLTFGERTLVNVARGIGIVFGLDKQYFRDLQAISNGTYSHTTRRDAPVNRV